MEQFFKNKNIVNGLELNAPIYKFFPLKYISVQVSIGKQYSNIKFGRTINRCGCDTTNITH